MDNNSLHDELLAADMRFKWAMNEYEKIRIINETLNNELEKLRSIIGRNTTHTLEGGKDDSVVK